MLALESVEGMAPMKESMDWPHTFPFPLESEVKV